LNVYPLQDPNDAPIDITQYVRPGTNFTKVIQLVDLSAFMFLVYASRREVEPKLKSNIAEDHAMWQNYLRKWKEKFDVNNSLVAGSSDPFRLLSEAVVSVVPS
jgi:hypothetical protein